MTVTEAMQAFTKTVESIVQPLTDRGLAVDKRFYYANRELNEIGSDRCAEAAVIAAEVRVVDTESHAEIMFEAAVAIEDGDVLNDEIVREATTMRANVKELIEALETSENTTEAFSSLIPVEDEEPVKPVQHNNVPYYIGGAVVVVLILLAALLFGK